MQTPPRHLPTLPTALSPGLPKPAILTYERVLQISGMLTLCGVTADDVVYSVLPLYHTMGLVLGVLSCLELGKPFSKDPPSTGLPAWRSGRQGPTGYPAPQVLTFDEERRAGSARAPWMEVWTPRSP